MSDMAENPEDRSSRVAAKFMHSHLGPGNSGAFNFSNFKARHCGGRFVVKSLLKAPAPWRLTIMWNNSRELV